MVLLDLVKKVFLIMNKLLNDMNNYLVMTSKIFRLFINNIYLFFYYYISKKKKKETREREINKLTISDIIIKTVSQ